MPDSPSLPPKETRDRLCPNCSSLAVMPLGRVTAEHTGVRIDYRCRDCSTDFVLLR